MAAKPDLSEFYKLSRPKKKPCQLGFALAQLSDVESDQLKAALATDVSIITAAAVVEWLRPRGHDVTFARVTNHRRGSCSCND